MRLEDIQVSTPAGPHYVDRAGNKLKVFSIEYLAACPKIVCIITTNGDFDVVLREPQDLKLLIE